MIGARFFPEARLNLAENLLKGEEAEYFLPIQPTSRASFLLRFTYGFTNCGVIRFTAYPRCCKTRAQPILQPGSINVHNTVTISHETSVV